MRDSRRHSVPNSETICIYCKATSSTPFPPEHIIPRQFGKFEPNLTIHCVCSECNRYFGQHLEWVLGGDTAEGILRVEHGLRPNRVGWQPETGIEIRYREQGPWFDCWIQIRPNPDAEGCIAEVIPQIGVRATDDETWKWYREREITVEIIHKHSTGRSQFIAVARNAEDRARLLKKVQDSGLTLGSTKEISRRFVNNNGKVPVVVRYTFRDAISRCIAKIVFNYLAHSVGARMTLASDFDRVRKYIRHGEELDLSKPGIVYIVNEPILTEERLGKRVTDGHLLRLGWENSHVLTGSVSLFNNLTYKVVLCRGYDGIWTDITLGHLFEIKSRTVSPLLTSSRLVF